MTDLEAIKARYPGAQAFRFGDGPELCAELTQLVIDGRKTATCGALRDFTPEDRPEVGRRDIACLWDWTPAAVIETVDVVERPFDEVPEAFALAEGEGDFQAWWDGHVRFFERNGGWSPDLPLLCERFRLVEVL
ncbi:ASCH domain-containing protein [Jannaschia formosa]|uniref:ASCH domain-containing protein n=1 Tax=Jannaschia formosa TaxID=2259592 RepID=UPI000E1C1C34|nr:ASCH domain-containing protein [Jannaschia formosa]TFL20244.1 ASCH domain-containing protein [Jannaschia formosa]